MASGVGWIGWRLRQKEAAPETAAASSSPKTAARDDLESLLKVEPLSVEVGLGLVGMVEGGPSSCAAAPHRQHFANSSPESWTTCSRRCV